MYAIIRDRGKQYRAALGDVVDLDHLTECKTGDTLEFPDVLLTSDEKGKVQVGTPTLSNVKVQGEVVLAHGRGDKIDVVHLRRRKDSTTKVGHRQPLTRVRISKLEVSG